MSQEQIKKPRGTLDYFYREEEVLSAVRSLLLNESAQYGCQVCEVPYFEESKLFHRTVGESSDIVSKETFDLAKKGDKDYTLRPEFTASVNRAVLENKLYTSPDMPLRLSYFGNVFRYERPQAGRLREFNQYGVEFIDSHIDIDTSIECLMLSLRASEKILGRKVKVKLNYLGSFASRENYKVALKAYFEPHIDSMCDDCKRRLVTNPLRILDCKVEEDQLLASKSPRIKDFLSEEDKNEYNTLLKVLNDLGVDYEVDDELVRGLDYYTGLVWELYDTSNLTVGAIGGGGKYSSLMKEIGGPEFEGIGFSLGVERLILSLTDERKNEIAPYKPLDVFVIDFLRDGSALSIAEKLRDLGLSVSFASFTRGLGGAMKMADRCHADRVLLVDRDGTYKVKDMTKREQTELKKEEVVDFFRKENIHA